jgi:hypothetical protein
LVSKLVKGFGEAAPNARASARDQYCVAVGFHMSIDAHNGREIQSAVKGRGARLRAASRENASKISNPDSMRVDV